MMKKIIISLLFAFIFLFSLVTAQNQEIGPFELNKCANLIQTCNNCTYVNISSIIYPNSSYALKQEITMEKSGTDYNYTFCLTSSVGRYIYNTHGDLDGTDTIGSVDFNVTPSGFELTTGSSILYFLFIVFFSLVFLFLVYLISILPKNNEKGDDGSAIRIIKLKYLRIILIAISYPILILIFNLLNGLAVQFSNLSMFSGIFGFIFETMLRLIWPFIVIIILWIGYKLIQDTNFKKQIKKINRIGKW